MTVAAVVRLGPLSKGKGSMRLYYLVGRTNETLQEERRRAAVKNLMSGSVLAELKEAPDASPAAPPPPPPAAAPSGGGDGYKSETLAVIVEGSRRESMEAEEAGGGGGRAAAAAPGSEMRARSPAAESVTSTHTSSSWLAQQQSGTE